MKMKAIGYWSTTVIIALVLLSGGIAQLLQRRENVEGIIHLGYPAYFLVILGFWKVLGSIALLVPRLPRIKEWAYAGTFFELAGASASHLFYGDSITRIAWPFVFAVLTVGSWALRPSSRILGVLIPTQEGGS